MNQHISGFGKLESGEYDDVSISGASKCTGSIRCKSFSASGSSKAEGDVRCEGRFRVSGSFHGHGDVEAGDVTVSGACEIGGSCKAKESVQISGACEIGKDLSVQGELKISGRCEVGGNAEAESAKISATFTCEGLLNADRLEIISYGNDCKCGSVGGSYIEARCAKFGKDYVGILVPRPRSGRVLRVEGSIEGDDIYLEYTTAKSVSGRKIVLGKHCEIGSIRYSESLEGEPDNKDCVIEKV